MDENMKVEEKKVFSDVELREFRQKIAALKIKKRTERLCLKCGTRDHGISPCPSKICPVCKLMDNHQNPYDCPYLRCNVCGDKHPVIACKKRPINYYAKCNTCGFLGHHGYECKYVQGLLADKAFYETQYTMKGINNIKEDFITVIDKLALINHRNNHCYFYQWLRILQRVKRKKKRNRKTQGKRIFPGKRKFAKWKKKY